MWGILGIAFLAFGWFGLAQPSVADVSGRVHVIDGDTFEVRGQRVRLYGIDAPEQKQNCTSKQGNLWACGAWVTDMVRARYQGQQASCKELGRDRYGRMVARCSIGGQDVARQLVQDGLAFAYRRYSLDYDLDERKAVRGDVGLHSSRIQTPGQFRRDGRAQHGTAPDKNCAIKGNISASGVRIFHSPGQRDYDRTRISTPKGERWFCSAAEARAAGWRAARR